jgi:hypothetical protein
LKDLSLPSLSLSPPSICGLGQISFDGGGGRERGEGREERGDVLRKCKYHQNINVSPNPIICKKQIELTLF